MKVRLLLRINLFVSMFYLLEPPSEMLKEGSFVFVVVVVS